MMSNAVFFSEWVISGVFMIEAFDGSDNARLRKVHELRREAFGASRRNPAFADAWIYDKYDQYCRHLLMTDQEGKPIASVRMILNGDWPLEERYQGRIDKDRGVEFGRLGVARRSHDGKRTLYELMVAASRQCLELDRPFMYGLTIAPFWTLLKKVGVPLAVISEPIRAYGEEQNVILFDANELVAFYDSKNENLKAIPRPNSQ